MIIRSYGLVCLYAKRAHMLITVPLKVKKETGRKHLRMHNILLPTTL